MKASLLIYVCIFSCGLIYTDACGILEQKVSDQEKANIVNLHNNLRKLVANGKVRGQPRGINLKRMKWDNKLATGAQQVSNTCNFEHVKIYDDRWYVGQNLFTSMATNQVYRANWTQAIMDWYNEYRIYSYGPNFQPAAGHYTQVVWANTEYVGCGYTFYEDETSFFRYKKLYTCNYGPGGNIGGQEPYQTGHSGCENLC